MKHPARALRRAAQTRARKRGVVFDILEEDIHIPEFCPVLGIKLTMHTGTRMQGGRPDSPSLDRIDNNIGYVKGNIQVISHLANSMKSTATPEQLKAFSAWVRSTYGE